MPQVVGEGLQNIEPSVTLTPVIKQAFMAGSSVVFFQGDSHEGSFAKAEDYCCVRRVNDRTTAVRRIVYEFQGWRETGGGNSA